MTERVIHVVFGVPIPHPIDREFLGAYSTRALAQRFIDAQPPSVQENLLIQEIPLDTAWCDREWWVIPEGDGESATS